VTKRQGRLNPPAQRPTAEIVERAWSALPHEHQVLLREVGAAQWKVVDGPLGSPVHKLLRSAGENGLSARAREDADDAMAVWLATLRVVVFNAEHSALEGLSERAYAQALARTAWHEWGHALSIVRCTPEDVRAGPRLLRLAPTAVDKVIRTAGYRPHEYTHELVANVYSALVERSQHDASGRPPWLHSEIYDLVKRVTGWSK
jgi:hypothetical protein